MKFTSILWGWKQLNKYFLRQVYKIAKYVVKTLVTHWCYIMIPSRDTDLEFKVYILNRGLSFNTPFSKVIHFFKSEKQNLINVNRRFYYAKTLWLLLVDNLNRWCFEIISVTEQFVHSCLINFKGMKCVKWQYMCYWNS